MLSNFWTSSRKKGLLCFLIPVCAAVGAGRSVHAAEPQGVFTDIYDFAGLATGAIPGSALTRDSAGNFYGTTVVAGLDCRGGYSEGCGSIYRLDPTGKVTTLFQFDGRADGVQPATPVTLFQTKLFGTATGGTNDDGVVYSINPDGTGYEAIHQFMGTDGRIPVSALQKAPFGGLFGITMYGGFPAATSNGVLYLVEPDGTFTVLVNFSKTAMGQRPTTLVRDPVSHNLYGTTEQGGAACSEKGGCGVVFEYETQTKTFSVLYSFTGGTDGYQPMLGSIGPDGTLYGTTGRGGAHNHGTLFSLTPSNGAFRFATLAAVYGNYEGDTPNAGPTLAKNGDLFFSTLSAIEAYQNGQLHRILDYQSIGVTPVTSQFLLGADGSTLIAPAANNGPEPCYLTPSYSSSSGCGSIFTYALPPPAS